jgi:hypothetical protein
MSERAAVFIPILMGLIIISLLSLVIIQALELGIYLQIQG